MIIFAPFTDKPEEFIVTAPSATDKLPAIVVFPEALKVVNAPLDAEFAPIAVPSIAPAFISTVDKVEVPVAVKSVVVVPPFAVNAPVNVDAPVTPNAPPTFKFFVTPAPPSTFKAPVVVLVD